MGSDYHIWSEEPLMQAKNDDDLCGGQKSTEVKYSKQCSVATKLGQKNGWCKPRMMKTLVEVKYSKQLLHGFQSWSEELLMQVEDDDDLHDGQRSTEVKHRKFVLWLPNGQKNHWCKFRRTITYWLSWRLKVGQQKPNIVNIGSMATKLQKITDDDDTLIGQLVRLMKFNTWIGGPSSRDHWEQKGQMW